MDVFSRFSNSYLKYSSGYDHDFIVLAKGLRNRGERVYIDDIFSKIDHKLISISDEGYDINAYLYIAKKLDHDYVLFCNTHTEILSEGWLGKMVAAAELKNVGLVGATASYESISISQKLVQKAVWLATNRKLPFDEKFYKSFRRYIDFHCQKWVRSGKISPQTSKRRLFSPTFFWIHKSRRFRR